MEIKEILRRVDHTLLSPSSKKQEIFKLCDEAIKYGTASVCIPPSFVADAAAYCGEKMKICTVIGFPCGYSTTAVKCFEAADAVKNGADEIDMVINIGFAKDGRWKELADEIRSVKAACEGKILKVIIETCLLCDDEKIKLCGIVSDAGADFIKTSTGFSSCGATKEDVALLRKYSPATLKVKAAGGIKGVADAEEFLKLGADRLGTSRVIKEVKENFGG